MAGLDLDFDTEPPDLVGVLAPDDPCDGLEDNALEDSVWVEEGCVEPADDSDWESGNGERVTRGAFGFADGPELLLACCLATTTPSMFSIEGSLQAKTDIDKYRSKQ